MRKVLLLCAMLLSIVGAYGITYPKVGVTYTIKNVNGFYHSDAGFRYYMMSNSDGNEVTGTGSVTEDNMEASQWVFEKADGEENAYYLKNYKTNKYIYVQTLSNSQNVALDASNKSKLYLFDGSSNLVAGEYFMSLKNANQDDGNSLGIHGNASMNTWEGNGLGNQWVLEEVAPVYPVYTIEGGTSAEGHRGFLAAGENYPNYPVLSDIAWSSHSGKSTTAISGGKYWYLHKINSNDTYVLFNLGLKKYLVLDSDNINFGDYPYAWKIVQNTNDPNYKAVCLYDDSKQISFACGSTAANRNVKPNNEMPDGGSKHTIKLVFPSDFAAFSEAIDKVRADVASLNNVSVPMTFTLVDNGSNEHSYTGAGELYPLISGVEDYVMQTPVWNGNTFKADITFPVPVSSETVSNPTFISTYNYSEQPKDQFKWYASENKIKVKEGEEIYSSSIASHLWLIYPKFNNGNFTFQIKNVATDLFINSTASVSGHDDNSTVVLSGDATDFTVGKRDNEGAEFINSNEMRLSVNTSIPNEGVVQTVGTNASHHGTALTFRKPGFNVTIGATGYATLYSPITVIQAPEENQLEIYQIETAAKNGRVELTQMYHVYKNQGVILKGESGTYSFALTDDYWEGVIEESMWDNNKLKGSFTDTYVQDDAYVLAKPTIDGIVQEVGLYKAELNKNENGEDGTTHFKNNAGKAYLPASEAASDARFLVFSFGDDMETGITETENGNVKAENDEVYDLAGRRVQNAQKGIFIVNGKMVVR